MIYLIGSLRNPYVPVFAGMLRRLGFTVWDDWYAAGPEADDKWQAYEQGRGRTLIEALNEGDAAEHVYSYDLKHLTKASQVVLLMPAGKSGFLELGWAIGRGKPSYIYLPQEPERWDVMFKFATGVYSRFGELVKALQRTRRR